MLALESASLPPPEAARIGLESGARYRAGGSGSGLTTLTCMVNLIPRLDSEDRSRALYHGLTEVAAEFAGSAPRFPIRPLPGRAARDPGTFKRWLRRFVAVRDEEGAERCIVSAVRSG